MAIECKIKTEKEAEYTNLMTDEQDKLMESNEGLSVETVHEQSEGSDDEMGDKKQSLFNKLSCIHPYGKKKTLKTPSSKQLQAYSKGKKQRAGNVHTPRNM